VDRIVSASSQEETLTSSIVGRVPNSSQKDAMEVEMGIMHGIVDSRAPSEAPWKNSNVSCDAPECGAALPLSHVDCQLRITSFVKLACRKTSE
jgi:hypothetical protein